MILLILFFSFVTCILFVYTCLSYLLNKNNSISRLKRYINFAEESRDEKKKSNRWEYKAGFDIIARRIGNAKFLDGYKNYVQMQLTRANVLLKAEEYIAICLILFTAVGLIFFALSSSLLYAAAGAAGGWLIPALLLKARIKKRLKFLNEQLGDALMLISNSLKAGYSFFQSIDIVARDMPGPIGEEFAVLQKEISLGLATEKALENMVHRTASDDLELVITAVLIQRQVGGNLAEVLDNISSTIRERVKIKGEVKTVTAQGKASGIIISLLPVTLGFILYLINPEHIKILFTDPMGIAILIFSIFMQLIGIYFINKIIKIEV